MKIRQALFAIVPILASQLAQSPARADAIEDFYRGRTIEIIVGFGPGGGFDAYARLLATHLPRHLPGKPNIVVQNMPGGGSLVAANHLYNAAPRDGSRLGLFGAFTNLEPLFGNPAAKFDGTKFTWIGNMATEYASCAISGAIPFETVADLGKRETVFGSSGQGSNTTQHVMVLRDLLGLKARIVQGYKGTSDIALALERGEIEATCGVMVSTARLLMAPRIDSGDTRIFIQFGRKSVEDFRGAANIYDLLRDEEDKKVAEVVFRPDEAARAFAAPPGLPPERTQALRRAFDNAMRDPALLADADKQRLPIELMRGEEVAALFAAIYATPEKTVARAKAVMDVK